MKKRIQWVDFGKGFFILWVVVAHALKSIYSRPIYSPQTNTFLHFLGNSVFFFIMPTFFALSGFLFQRRSSLLTFMKFVTKKAITLFVPYIVFSIIYVFLQHFGSNINHRYTFTSLLHIWYQPISYLWFLYVLFFIFVFVGLLSLLQISFEVQFIISFIGFILVCFFNLKLSIFQMFGNTLFFLTGTLTHKYLSLIKVHKVRIYIISQLLSIVAYITCLIIIGVHRDYNNPTLINIIPKIIVSFTSLMLCMILSENNAFFQYFDRYGKDSLVIYLVHAPAVSVACVLIFKFVTLPAFLTFILLVLVGWYSSIIIIWLSYRVPLIRLIFSPYKAVCHFIKK